MIYHAEGLALERDSRGLACRTNPCGPVRMATRRTRYLDTIIWLYQWRQCGCCSGGSLRCELAEVGVIGKVFYIMILVVFAVIRLQRHAIITHSVGPVLAEIRVSTSGNLSVPCSPILIYGTFFDILPRSACQRFRTCRRRSFVGDAILGCAQCRPLSIRDKDEFAVSKATG